MKEFVKIMNIKKQKIYDKLRLRSILINEKLDCGNCIHTDKDTVCQLIFEHCITQMHSKNCSNRSCSNKKKLSETEDITYKRIGFQKKGIPPRLAKKRSVIEKIKREKSSIRTNEELDKELENGEISQEEFENKKNMMNSNGRFPFSVAPAFNVFAVDRKQFPCI